MKLVNLIVTIIGILGTIVVILNFLATNTPVLISSLIQAHIILIPILTSAIIILIIVLLKNFGIFQEFELQAYDHLLQLRPNEKEDNRILIITVDAEDLKYQDQLNMQRGAKSISDKALTIILEKLNQHQPTVIGLDIYRNFPANSEPLATLLKQKKNLIATCLVETLENSSGEPSPPEILEEQRLGFANIPKDYDGVIRRQFLGMAKPNNSVCQTDHSLSFRIALSYLKQERNILPSQLPPNNILKIGNTIFHKFEFNAGGYQLPKIEGRGYQILINYRSSSNTVFKQISLQTILDGSIDSLLPQYFNHKIILIGTIAKSYKDWHLTPYSNSKRSKKMAGIIIQAHMISQIVSSVLDNRPLLSWWPQWGETLWNWMWSLVGGALGLYYLLGSASASQFIIAIILALCFLYVLTFFFLLRSRWVPIISSALSLILSSLTIVITNYFIPFKNW
ncbi:MAG: CHASE2 domain-containing protein [Xenococcus sp. (in: cyanobacteria)]